jgi:hypothetical protein
VQADPNAPKNAKTSTVVKDYVLDFTTELRNVIMETETNGLNYRYVFGLDKLSAATNSNVKLYYHHDSLGTVDFLTDGYDSKVKSYVEYDECGRPTNIS